MKVEMTYQKRWWKVTKERESNRKGDDDMIQELVTKARSYRRFDESKKISMEQLKEFANLGRLSPCGGNKQYIKYALICEEAMNEKVFECLGWAGYLKDWDGAEKGERPTGYIVLLRDKTINGNMTVDEGIAAQSIFLGAMEQGIGGCMIMNCNREKLANYLELDTTKYAISMVIALGVPKEIVVIEEMQSNDDVTYYRDENKVHHVPKRKLDDIIAKIIE